MISTRVFMRGATDYYNSSIFCDIILSAQV